MGAAGLAAGLLPHAAAGVTAAAPPHLPHHPHHHPALDSLNFSFPLSFPGLNPAMFKLPSQLEADARLLKLPQLESDNRPLFRFKTS